MWLPTRLAVCRMWSKLSERAVGHAPEGLHRQASSCICSLSGMRCTRRSPKWSEAQRRNACRRGFVGEPTQIIWSSFSSQEVIVRESQSGHGGRSAYGRPCARRSVHERTSTCFIGARGNAAPSTCSQGGARR